MSSTRSTPTYVGARVVIVEDSYVVAAGLEYLLTSAGCDVVGKAGSLGAAIDLLDTVAFEVALLDIDLHGDNVAPVADEIRQRDKPIIFLSGYGETDILPSHLQSLPRLEKPVNPAELFAALERALDGRASGNRIH